MRGACGFVVVAILCLLGYFLLLRGTSLAEYVQTILVRILRIVGNWRLWLLGWILVLVVALLLPPIPPCNPPWRRARCINNLKQIGLAFDNYYRKHGSFPPAFSTDANAKPLHSWRVHLLPYLEEQALYNQLRLDEPWDSPHNKKVLDSADIPDVFSCPSDPESNNDTNYVMVVGPGTISDGPNAVRREEIADGPEVTILVVEMANSGIHWAEPHDLKFNEMSFQINDPAGMSIRSNHPGVANVVLADGSVQSISENIDPKALKALITIAGGEEFPVPW